MIDRIALITFLLFVPAGARAQTPQESPPAAAQPPTSSAPTTPPPTPSGEPATIAAPRAALPPPKITGYVQARETFLEPRRVTALLNRVRIGVDGTLPARFTWRATVEYEAPTGDKTAAAVSLRDAYIRWSPSPYSVTAGQFKVPFSREFMTSLALLETLDRSAVVDTLAIRRDVGVMAEAVASSYATISVGAYNGEGQNATANRDTSVLVVGRMSTQIVPYTSIAGSVGRFSADSLRYDADATIEFRGFVLRGEMLGQHKRGRDKDDFGWFVLGGYRVLPWLQVIARQEDFQRPSISQARRISATTAGINAEVVPARVRLSAHFVDRATGYPRTHKQSGIVQLQVRF
jgi:hypothetical protein